MTGSLDEVRAVLAAVSERLNAAYGCTRTAEEKLAEAAGVLTELGQAHGQRLLPAELTQACEQLERGRELISYGVDSVEGIAARL